MADVTGRPYPTFPAVHPRPSLIAISSRARLRERRRRASGGYIVNRLVTQGPSLGLRQAFRSRSMPPIQEHRPANNEVTKDDQPQSGYV
jgi:hypothetical protein